MTADEARRGFEAAVTDSLRSGFPGKVTIMAAAERWVKAEKLEVLDGAIPPYWAEHSPGAMIHLGGLQEWLAELRARIEAHEA